MKRLINFSGPVHTRQAREHAHRGRKERNAGARTPAALVYTWPLSWLCREANSFPKVLECIVSRASFLSFWLRRSTVPFHSVYLSCANFMLHRYQLASEPVEQNTLSFHRSILRRRDRALTRRKCSSTRPLIKRRDHGGV